MKSKSYTIIGSGVGALTAGAILARQGHKVELFEKFDQLGGYATLFKRKGFTFDVSLHQIGGVHSGGMHRMLTAAGVYDRLTYIQHDSLSELKTPSGDYFAIPNGKGDLFRDMLIERFPEEKKAIHHWFAVMKQYGREFRLLNMREKSAFHQAIIDLCAPMLYPRILWASTVGNVQKSAFRSNNRELMEILQHFSFYYGLPINEINELFPMIANYGYYYHGGYYLKGGGHELARQLAQVICENGGIIHTKSEITAVEIVQNRAVSATINGTSTVAVENLICGCAPQVLYGKLIKENKKVRGALEKSKSMTASATCSVLYVALDCPIGELNSELANAYEFSYESVLQEQEFYEMFQNKRDFEGDYSQWPLTFSIHSNIDSSCLPPEGGCCFDLIFADNYDRWNSLTKTQYSLQKAIEIDKMLAHLERKVPSVRDHIVVAELGTPKTMERYTGNPRGAIYGFAQTVRQSMFKRPSRSVFKNIAFASAWSMPGGGYEGAVESGYRIAIKDRIGGYVLVGLFAAAFVVLQILVFLFL